MSRYSRSPSLARHRSFERLESSGPEELPASPTVGSTSISPARERRQDGFRESPPIKSSRAARRRNSKIIALSLLVLVIFFFLEWRYLSSFVHGRLSRIGRPGSSLPASLQTEELGGSTKPMFERLLGLAAHALAEHESQLEPDELWKEPLEGSSKWRPCADERPPGYLAPPTPQRSSGYIVVNADGGLNQQRVATCNAVAVARLLNATLVLPHFMFNSVWRDTSQFGDIYEEKFFVDYLKDDVHIVSELPSDLQSLDLAVIGSLLTNVEVPKESMPSFFVNRVLPVLLRNRVVYFYGFTNALAFDPIPTDIQRLRCRCNYHALKFRSHIKETAGLMLRRLREKDLRLGTIKKFSSTSDRLSSNNRLSTLEEQLLGFDSTSNNRQHPNNRKVGTPFLPVAPEVEPISVSRVRYLGLHLRFEKDMVAYSLCDFGGGEAERQDLAAYREIHFPTLSKYQESGKKMTAAQLREVGRCPLTPEEAVLMLASLGFKRSTRIFLAGSHIYGGQARMATISSLYPNLVTKEDLLTADEIAPFVNHSSQLAALDFIGCAAADAFAMTDSGSQLSSLASGYRIYHGEGQLPTIRPNKRRLAKIFTENMTIEWEDFEEKVRKTVSESQRLIERPIARSIFRHPRCHECMCR